MPYAVTQTQRNFFNSTQYAVVGASNDKSKFGNKVFMWYIDRSKPVTPIHPKEEAIEGVPTLRNLSALPEPLTTSISVITPPKVTLGVLKEAVGLKIPVIWIQPGAEDEAVINYIKENELEDKVVYGGPCVIANGDTVLKSLEGKEE